MEDVKVLKERADKARLLYKKNLISRYEALEQIKPYIDVFNERSKTIAKKYNMKPKFLNYASYMR